MVGLYSLKMILFKNEESGALQDGKLPVRKLRVYKFINEALIVHSSWARTTHRSKLLLQDPETWKLNKHNNFISVGCPPRLHTSFVLHFDEGP